VSLTGEQEPRFKTLSGEKDKYLLPGVKFSKKKQDRREEIGNGSERT